MNCSKPLPPAAIRFSGRALAQVLGTILLGLLASAAAAAEVGDAAAREVLSRRCYECHGGAKTKGGVDFKRLAADPKVAEEFTLWEKVRNSVISGDMPPTNAKPLAAVDKEALVMWTTAALDSAAAAKSGDPGPVTMRRLTNAEYDYTLRDLTGRDFRLAKEFQADGGGGEGFSNTGDVLFLSPAALDSYFNAARKVADHATIMPGTGIAFHEHRIGLRGPEQVKAQAQHGLNDWYQQKAALHLPKDLEDMREADYLLACWKHRHFKETIEKLAKDDGLKRPFLQNWWGLVNGTEPKSRFLDLTRVAWRELPAPDAENPIQVPPSVTQGVKAIQAQLRSWNNSTNPGGELHRWFQDAGRSVTYPLTADVSGKNQVDLCIGDLGDGNRGDIALVTKIELRTTRGVVNYLDWLQQQLADDRRALHLNPLLVKKLQPRIVACERARKTFGSHPQGRKIEPQILALAAPQVFTMPLPEDVVRIHIEINLDLLNPDARHATVQWTLATDQPCDVTKVLAGVPIVWKHQPEEAGRAMSEFMELRTAFPESFTRRLERVAINLRRKAPGTGVYYLSDEQLQELLGKSDSRWLEALRKDLALACEDKVGASQQDEWSQLVLGHLRRFAVHAWRRPLHEGEHRQLEALYMSAWKNAFDSESAAREVIVWVLVSPHFLFKAETLPAAVRPDTGEVPLSAWELAARLSYFLWASLPDEELRQAAESGTLTKPDVLVAQARRMLRDPKAVALAQEFAGQWLKFGAEEESGLLAGRRSLGLSVELWQDMQREAVEFFAHLFREERSLRDILEGDYSFINERLAKHYGIPGVIGGHFREVRLAEGQRGGLLGMGTMLVKTSHAHRTSPVLRGDYLYQVVLGYSVPPPPPNVAKLDDSGLKPVSMRQALQRHRDNMACAVCHDRMDPLGFTLAAH